MSRNHQLNLPPSLVKAVAPARATDDPTFGQVVVPAETDALSLLVEAVAETCSDKEAYISLGLPDAPYWSKVKAREKPAPRIPKLTDLPEKTQKELVKRWGRQLRMRVSEEDERKAAVLDLLESATRVIREIA